MTEQHAAPLELLKLSIETVFGTMQIFPMLLQVLWSPYNVGPCQTEAVTIRTTPKRSVLGRRRMTLKTDLSKFILWTTKAFVQKVMLDS